MNRNMEKCETCQHKKFRDMLKNFYAHSGSIPCLTCKYFIFVEDNYFPINSSKEVNYE